MIEEGKSSSSAAKRRVAYFYDNEIGNYHYGQGHPMKVLYLPQLSCMSKPYSLLKYVVAFQPHRVRMTHHLVVNYQLYKKMDIFRPKLVSASQLTRFHSDDYINFLRLINPGTKYFNYHCDFQLIFISHFYC